MHGAEGAGPYMMLFPSESRDVLCLWSCLIGKLSYVIRSVSMNCFEMDYLLCMWSCKYSYVVSSFYLTINYCIEMSIKGVIILVADKFTSLSICFGE